MVFRRYNVNVGRKSYVYVMVRKDLSGPQIAVQAIHASIEVARNSHISPQADHPSVVLLGADNERRLRKCLEQVQSFGFVCKSFFEADLDDEMTAFATEPIFSEDRHYFKKYQLIKPSDMACLEGGAV